MSPNERRTSDSGSTDDRFRRRSVLRGVAGLGATGTLLGAAAGSATAHPKDHRITLIALTDHVKYRIEVDGELETGRHADGDVTVRHGSVATGKLSKGEFHDFRFSGKIELLQVKEGKAALLLDHERVDPKEVGKKSKKKKEEKRDKKEKDEKKKGKDEEKEKDEEKKKKRTVSFHAQGPNVKYEFVVSGHVKPGPKADIGVGDHIDGKTVTGKVAGGGVDDYEFTGEIEKFHVSGDDVTVTLDGKEVDPDDLTEWGYVFIQAQGKRVEYEFRASGAVEPASEADIGVGDHIDGSTATGNVAGRTGKDTYWYSGGIEKFHVSRDEVTVRVDGEDVDPDEVADRF